MNVNTGKLCKYFFTQLSVTVLVIVVFEANSENQQYLAVATFIKYQIALLVIDLFLSLLRKQKIGSDGVYEDDWPEGRFAKCVLYFFKVIGVVAYVL